MSPLQSAKRDGRAFGHNSPWTARCPYCTVVAVFHPHPHGVWRPHTAAAKARHGEHASIAVAGGTCAACGLLVIAIRGGVHDGREHDAFDEAEIVWPPVMLRDPAPPKVEADLRQDYDEAIRVLQISPQSTATLARRILQIVLVRKAGAPSKKTNLNAQIDDVIKRDAVPGWIAENLHVIRELGNYGAHHAEDVDGETIRLDEDQAMFVLEVIGSLFQHFYVQPAVSAAHKARLATMKASKLPKPGE